MPATPIDEADLTDRARKALGGRDIEPIVAFTGGTSSLTFWTTIVDSGEQIVLKVCPPGLQPVRNRDVLRQAKVQKALHGTAVPAPEVLAEDAGAPVEVPPFYVMRKEPGDCIELGSLSPEDLPPPDDVRGRWLDVARLMGELHRIDPNTIGLGDEPETALDAEVQRWIDMIAACDEDQRADTEDIGERLLATIPDAMPSRLLHGDFRTGNVLAEGDHVTSVIDWEIWSRCDPRIDLAWCLIFVENRADDPLPGTPTVDELLERYTSVLGNDVSDLDWFRGLVRYKQFAAGAFITRNARRRGAPVTPVDNTQQPLLVGARHYLGM
jgi:aminoglycoside phosphotransferase (APT) family kinase protein